MLGKNILYVVDVMTFKKKKTFFLNWSKIGKSIKNISPINTPFYQLLRLYQLKFRKHSNQIFFFSFNIKLYMSNSKIKQDLKVLDEIVKKRKKTT